MAQRVDRILLSSVMLGNFLAGVAARIFAISLPSVAHGLETDLVGISWALVSYELSAISFSVVFGRIGDIYGRLRVYSLGLLFLTASSFLCGLSQNIVQLIVFRFIQGVAAAMTQSTGRALAMESMPEGATARSQGLMTMAFATGSFLGPSLGGLIIDFIHWRGIFFFVVPIGAIGTFLAFANWRRLKAFDSTPPSAAKPSVDYLGAGLLLAATCALLAVLNQRVMEIMTFGQRALLLLLFGGALGGFLLRESTVTSPVVDLSLFRIRMFAFSSLSLLLLSITYGLTLFILPFYLQEVLHLSPSFIGVLFMTPPFFTLTLSAAVGSLTDRTGPRLPATAGVSFHVVALFLGTTLRADSHWLLPAALLALGGLGNALFLTPNHSAMLGSVPAQHRGLATGALYLTFNLGMILGISLGGFLMTKLFRLISGVPTAVPSALDSAAFVTAFNVVFGVAVGLSLVALIASAMRGAKVSQQASLYNGRALP
ncbi:MAG: MFS transporter [Deltaproteobacteria bacterium]|nr:MFS transporter [Deltaproteobacteria bacterium]